MKVNMLLAIITQKLLAPNKIWLNFKHLFGIYDKFDKIKG